MNCRQMEEVIFQRPVVFGELEQFVEARLHTDGFGDHRPITRRNQALREDLTGAVSTPIYVVIDPESGSVLGIFEGATQDASTFARWLAEVRVR